MRRTSAIWATLGLAVLASLATGRALADDEKPDKGGFVPLFGTPTWFIHKGGQNTWGTYDDGTIFTRRGGGGWYMTKKEYADFELHLEIKMSENADTGICFRNSVDTDPSFDGNQIQFVDALRSRNWEAEGKTGGVWDVVGPKKLNVLKPVGDWNTVDVVAKGSRLVVKINDEETLDVDLEKYKHRTTEKGGGAHIHPDLLRKKGHIGLQSWGGLVEFRNLKIKELK
jgi:hypothetical protein